MNGGYGIWLVWGVCSKSCLIGYKVRVRYCNNLWFVNGGKDCLELGLLCEIFVCRLWFLCDGKVCCLLFYWIFFV